MTQGTSIFGASDPVALLRDWMERAAKTEPNDPNAIALGTVDANGLPNVRIVLLKEIEADAFVFYTNYDSAKGLELTASGQAAFAIHWKTMRRQVRVRGTVEREDGAQADAYYASRDLGSRLGAWASEQSRPLADRATLEARVKEAADRFGDAPPRPDHWGGFRIRPVEIEFWQDGEHRLHDRERWVKIKNNEQWDVKRLFP
ncbi:Pyridoxine/pyridoxamine 5'-phosphate oxidase [Rhodobacteraceae bacterium THAF1]|uniref:pyridoxamine 5'-phosphate oxidase n=1 Tax=Palleronia sp. THAF1 TaxID=2587842 RepID=UPI000F3C6F16|nr:Pyridoxine/pyridoxamine 5'-phosphate oxidase [Palleronia sp. THAF1]VDC29203.1 Pyridoxine/pyridoxamine 5'-phosphate oxidase [Rhodobacteraceae bacterium THAF1]